MRKKYDLVNIMMICSNISCNFIECSSPVIGIKRKSIIEEE